MITYDDAATVRQKMCTNMQLQARLLSWTTYIATSIVLVRLLYVLNVVINLPPHSITFLTYLEGKFFSWIFQLPKFNP